MTTHSAKHDLVITHVFDASVETVWKAWIDPEQVMRWWGPDHFTSPSAKIDFREGGIRFSACVRLQDFGGQDMYSTWDYTSIVPLERFEYIHNLADKEGHKINPTDMGMPADFPQDQRHVIAFKSVGDNKTEVTVTEYGWTEGQMMEMSRMGMEQCLNKMAAIFATA